MVNDGGHTKSSVGIMKTTGKNFTVGHGDLTKALAISWDLTVPFPVMTVMLKMALSDTHMIRHRSETKGSRKIQKFLLIITYYHPLFKRILQPTLSRLYEYQDVGMS